LIYTTLAATDTTVAAIDVGDDDDDDDNNNNNNNNNKNWYEHVPKSVETTLGGKIAILWNQQVQTDRTIPSNKPDIIIRDNEKGTCMLIDTAISGDRNVIKKEAEKILKYKDLNNRNKTHVGCKTMVIPVIIGAKETISKSFTKYVSNIPGNREFWELQKIAILGTAHILRKVLMYNRANAGAGDIGTINSNDRIAATVYSIGTWFVSGIYV
jgi:hypothetical protein